MRRMLVRKEDDTGFVSLFLLSNGISLLERIKSAQELFITLRALEFQARTFYSLSSMVTLTIFTAGSLRLFGSRGGMDMSTSSPSTT